MKKRIIIMSGIIVFMLVAYIGFSYALFTKSKEQEGINQITTYNCLDISINGEEELNLTNAYPIKDEEGVLQTPYTFTITNNCEHYVGVDIGVEYLEESTISPSIIKATLNKPSEGIMPQILSSYNLVQATDSETGLPTETAKYIMVHEGLPAGDSQTFEYRMWLDYSVENLSTSDKLKVKIVGIGTVQSEEEAPNNWWSAEEGTLLAALRGNNSIRKPLTTPGRQINLPTESVLASALDDYGTSYYFRGNVQNNYVVFANKCWKIVRITGDGSIKLVLYNDNPNNLSDINVCQEEGEDLAFARYSGDTYKTVYRISKYNNEAYTGFMYGDPEGTTYDEKYANLHDNLILTRLKTWYDLGGTFTNNEKGKLSDVIWCDDKSISSYTANGYINYASFDRLYNHYYNSANPNMVCPNATENQPNLYKMTASDIINGNGALDGYKIGLLTADEIAYAGLTYGVFNENIYLSKNSYSNPIWTMTPFRFNGINNFVFAFSTKRYSEANTIVTGAIRPSIALIPTITIISGDGTINNPYVINES